MITSHTEDPDYTKYKRGLAQLVGGAALATAGLYAPKKLVNSSPLARKVQTASILGSIGLVGYGSLNMATVPFSEQQYYRDRLIGDTWAAYKEKTAGTLDTFKGATNIARPFNTPKSTGSAATTKSTLLGQTMRKSTSPNVSASTSTYSASTKTAAMNTLVTNYLSKVAAAQGRYVPKKKVPYRGPKYNPEWDMFNRRWSSKINIPNVPKSSTLSTASKAGLAAAALGTLGLGSYGMHKQYTNDF